LRVKSSSNLFFSLCGFNILQMIEQLTFGNPCDELTEVRSGVMVFVIDASGRILLEKRSDCSLWGLPGGRIDPGETIEEAAIREVFEETGLRVKIARLLGIYSDPKEGRIVKYPRSHKTVQLVDSCVEAKVLSGSLQKSGESLDLQFFTSSELPAREQIVRVLHKPLDDFLSNNIPTLA
jgi:8-oxo-dGTP pyrophosphatase MutT (NUDIX family)